jgi:hypothetical protein
MLSLAAGLQGGVVATTYPAQIQGMCWMTADVHPAALVAGNNVTDDACVLKHGSRGSLFSVSNSDLSCFVDTCQADRKLSWHLAVGGHVCIKAYSDDQVGVAHVATRIIGHRTSNMLLGVATLEHPAPAGFSPFLVVLAAAPADADSFFTPACPALAGVEPPERALRVQQLAGLAISADRQEAVAAAALLLPELHALGIRVPLSDTAPQRDSAMPGGASDMCDTLLTSLTETIQTTFPASTPAAWSHGNKHLLLAEAARRTATTALRTSRKQHPYAESRVPALGAGSTTLPKTAPVGEPLCLSYHLMMPPCCVDVALSIIVLVRCS